MDQETTTPTPPAMTEEEVAKLLLSELQRHKDSGHLPLNVELPDGSMIVIEQVVAEAPPEPTGPETPPGDEVDITSPFELSADVPEDGNFTFLSDGFSKEVVDEYGGFTTEERENILSYWRKQLDAGHKNAERIIAYIGKGCVGKFCPEREAGISELPVELRSSMHGSLLGRTNFELAHRFIESWQEAQKDLATNGVPPELEFRVDGKLAYYTSFVPALMFSTEDITEPDSPNVQLPYAVFAGQYTKDKATGQMVFRGKDCRTSLGHDLYLRAVHHYCVVNGDIPGLRAAQEGATDFL